MSEQVQGVLQILNKGGGFLRNPDMSFQATPQDSWVSSKLIREFGMEDGASISGSAEAGKKGLQLLAVESICGLAPEQFQNRTRFDQLLAISPTERMKLAKSGNVSMRVVELVAPIGKGTRGMIVASPKTGKTLLLEQIANAIHAHEPDTRIVVLLIDERPEEVTHFRRNVHAEVLASSSDQSIASHTNLAELTMAHIRCELECGRDVVVLLDSITRLGRAFNLHGAGSRRTMSGGLDAKALEIPRRFFGLARNIEHGGSVTVIATALVDTGSRMDDYIFEEFKGTGNSEIVLDRGLAEARIFPAINIKASGTRREELLYPEAEMEGLTLLRRKLSELETKEAMLELLKLLESEADNEKLLRRLRLRN